MSLTISPSDNFTMHQSGIRIYTATGYQRLNVALDEEIAPGEPFQVNMISLRFVDNVGNPTTAAKDITITVRDASNVVIGTVYAEAGHADSYLTIMDVVRQPHANKLHVNCSVNGNVYVYLYIVYELI